MVIFFDVIDSQDKLKPFSIDLILHGHLNFQLLSIILYSTTITSGWKMGSYLAGWLQKMILNLTQLMDLAHLLVI